MRKLNKRNAYRVLSDAEQGCVITINRWLIGKAAAICKSCGVKFIVDDSSIDYEHDTIDAVVAVRDGGDYIAAAQDMHNELGVDLSPI